MNTPRATQSLFEASGSATRDSPLGNSGTFGGHLHGSTAQLIEVMPSHPPETAHPWGDSETPYEEIGGADEVRRLADAFYDVIEEESPGLRAMLPSSTKNTRKKFSMYLSGWLGGPPLYEEAWGHPRLRMRHLPFPIGTDEAEEWMRCMRAAMDRVGIEHPLRSFLDERFEPLADHMRNKKAGS